MKIICLTILTSVTWCQCTGIVWNIFATYLLLVCQVFRFFPKEQCHCLVQQHKFWLLEDVVWRTICSTDCCFWNLCARAQCEWALILLTLTTVCYNSGRCQRKTSDTFSWYTLYRPMYHKVIHQAALLHWWFSCL